MAGDAPELGQAILAGILTPILGALKADDAPERIPTPTPPTIERPGLIAGISSGTLLLLGVGAFLLFKLAK
jgi:hypothetical protein